MQNQNHIESYRILLKGGEAEIIEKKSRFIATVRKVESEEEAAVFIEEVKKKNWNAAHNCFAFIIGKNAELTRCSDDGEPSGTAGRPMLEVLLGEQIRNIAVVVTRYFGGTLLGTGGLVRAYTQAVKEGIQACKIGTMRYGFRLRVDTDYNGIGKILYILGQYGIEAKDAAYTEKVSLNLIAPIELYNNVTKEITEGTNGKAKIEVLEEIYYVDKDQPV